MPELSPVRPVNDEARALARRLLAGARFGALATLDPASGRPHVTRIAVATTPDGLPLTLVSDLAAHTRALRSEPAVSLLVGEPGPRGDPLTHPRLTIAALARFVPRESERHATLRAHYLSARPKAGLYADFADFSFVVLEPQAGSLNAGFGRAYDLAPTDLLP